MKCNRSLVLSAAALVSTVSLGAERAIAVPPTLQMSWEFVTPGAGARLRPHLGVGFWQRGSGAKPGVGANYVSALEYQLPEAAPARVRSATFQFSGRPSQCVGAEPIVVDVSTYAANGKAEVADAHAGSRVAQLQASCSDGTAFGRPIDVTAAVRQLSIPAGVRFVGINIRQAGNRQGPGLFELSAGKLTIVLADEPIAQGARSRPSGAMPSTVAQAAPTARPSPPLAKPIAPAPGAVGAQRTTGKAWQVNAAKSSIGDKP